MTGRRIDIMAPVPPCPHTSTVRHSVLVGKKARTFAKKKDPRVREQKYVERPPVSMNELSEEKIADESCAAADEKQLHEWSFRESEVRMRQGEVMSSPRSHQSAEFFIKLLRPALNSSSHFALFGRRVPLKSTIAWIWSTSMIWGIVAQRIEIRASFQRRLCNASEIIITIIKWQFFLHSHRAPAPVADDEKFSSPSSDLMARLKVILNGWQAFAPSWLCKKLSPAFLALENGNFC